MSEIFETSPDEFEETLSTFLLLQFKFPFSRSSIIRISFHVYEPPRTEFCGPFGDSVIMLFEPMRRVFTDSNIESARRIAPYYIQEEWFVGYARHGRNGKGPLRLWRIGPMVAGVGFEPTTFGL